MWKELINQLNNYDVILKPDKDLPNWWAGAPSVIIDKNGIFYLAARMRESNSPRGRRGYEIRILKSSDGINFKKIKSIHRDEIEEIYGFERPALVIEPESNKFILYGCGEMKEGWGIWKLKSANKIEDLDPSTFQKILTPEKPKKVIIGVSDHHSTISIQYKDPFIIHIKDQWHMFVIGFDRIERTYHFVSFDGINWNVKNNHPILENMGWHNFYTRPACIYPLDIGYMLVYEGSNINWIDPGYNIASGLAYSLDLSNFIDLTPESPMIKSDTPYNNNYFSWRYSHWIKKETNLFVYFEATNYNKTNEIRLAQLNLNLSSII